MGRPVLSLPAPVSGLSIPAPVAKQQSVEPLPSDGSDGAGGRGEARNEELRGVAATLVAEVAEVPDGALADQLRDLLQGTLQKVRLLVSAGDAPLGSSACEDNALGDADAGVVLPDEQMSAKLAALAARHGAGIAGDAHGSDEDLDEAMGMARCKRGRDM